MKTEILILKAYEGDCILIKTFDIEGAPYNILIDGGPSNTFDFSLRSELSKVEKIDLLILTHIDSDHIGGIIKFVNNSLFDEVKVVKYWINCKNLIEAAFSNSISYGQAKNLEELLIDKKEPIEKFSDEVTNDLNFEVVKGINFTVLSPPPEILKKLNEDWIDLSEAHKNALLDVRISSNALSQLSKGSLKELSEEKFKPQKSIENDIFNSASIALLIEGRDFKFLSLADSRPEIVEKHLRLLGYNDIDNKLRVDFVKVSHHGSKNNTSNELLDLISCDNYIITTNGGGVSSRHPDRETIARIIYHPRRNFEDTVNIFFNYPINVIEDKAGKIFEDKDFEDGNWSISDDIYKLPL